MTLTAIVRPFIVKDSRPDPAPARGAATDLGALANVSITWGASGDFDLPAGGVYTGAEYRTDPNVEDQFPQYRRNGAIIPPGDFLSGAEDEPLQDLTEVLNFREVARSTEDVRIYNEDDSEVYVDVRRITSVTFSGPNAYLYKFQFNHPPEDAAP